MDAIHTANGEIVKQPNDFLAVRMMRIIAFDCLEQSNFVRCRFRVVRCTFDDLKGDVVVFAGKRMALS